MPTDTLHTPDMASANVVPLPEQTYFRIPSSPLTKLIYDAFTAGKHLDRLEEGKTAVNRKVTLDVREEDGKTVFEYQNSRGTLYFSLPADVLKSGRLLLTAKKLFLVLLVEWNRQQEESIVTVPLSFFYEKYAVYKWNNITHQLIKRAIPLLAFISVWGEQRITADRKKTELVHLEEETPLFDRLFFSGNKLKFFINPAFRGAQKLIFEFFPCLPSFFFNLTPDGQDLLFHVFYVARQNLDALDKGQAFAVSYMAAHAALCLPGEEENRRYLKQKGLDPLIAAVDDINRNAANTGLTLVKRDNLAEAAGERLRAGKIEVSITGVMLESYLPMIERRKREQEKAIRQARRREKRLDARAAEASAKAL